MPVGRMQTWVQENKVATPHKQCNASGKRKRQIISWLPNFGPNIINWAGTVTQRDSAGLLIELDTFSFHSSLGFCVTGVRPPSVGAPGSTEGPGNAQ